MSAATTAYRDLHMGRIFVYPAGKRRIELKFNTTAGDAGRVAIDFGDVSEFRLLQRELRNAGYGGSAFTRADSLALDEHVIRYARSPKGLKALTPVHSSGGWNSRRSSFVLGNIELPSGREAPRPLSIAGPIYAVNGTMAGWKSSVAKLAAHSSRAILMIAAALVAPSLALAGVEAGGFGFNLWGPSSSGKTTALRAAASVLAGDFVGSWNGTTLGLQELAQQFCDLPMTIDSLESVTGEAQRELSETVAYTLGNGKTRIRSKSWLGKDGASGSFRTVLLSTAETQYRRAQKAGAAVRLIDVPVARDRCSTLGIVDYIPAQIPVERHPAFAASVIERIAAGGHRHHGHALPAFIGYLIVNQKLARHALSSGQAMFLQRFGHSGLSNTESRILGHFALTFAAGRLGIAAGILPWSEGHLFDAIRRCATDALDNSNERAKRNADNATRVLNWLADPTRTLIEHTPDLDRSQITTADALTAEVAGPGAGDDDFKPAKLVLRPMLQCALGLSAKDIAGAMIYLRETGKLVTEARDDAMTVQYKFRNCSARFYVVRD